MEYKISLIYFGKEKEKIAFPRELSKLIEKNIELSCCSSSKMEQIFSDLAKKKNCFASIFTIKKIILL